MLLNRMLPLLMMLLSLPLAFGKQFDLKVRWQEIPKSIQGQAVRVVQTDNKVFRGLLANVESDGLVLTMKGSEKRSIPRAQVARIEMRKRGVRTKGRILGVAIGGGIGTLIASAGLTYTHNEGGRNSGAINAATVSVGAGIAVLGYLAGRDADSDKTIVTLIPE